MKQARIVYATIILLSAFAAIIHSSCTKDSCSGVMCQNGGTCSQGACQCPSGYFGNLCQQSTIIYVNNAFTPLTLTVNNTTHILSPLGGFASYSGNSGSQAVVTAFTSAVTDSGVQVGEMVKWSFTNNFPTGSAALTVPINVPVTYFYLKMANADNYATPVNYIIVNYKSDSPVTDSVNLPNNGDIYGIGYFKTMPDMQLYAVHSADTSWTLNIAILDSPNAIATVVVP